jgi:membrane protein
VSLVMTTVVSMVGQRLLEGMNSDISKGLLFAADLIISLIVIGMLFAAMFKWLPDTEVAWRDALVGGFVTAFMFLLGKFLLGLYLGRQDQDTSAYGPAASLVLILVWVYYSAMIFLLGAEFTQGWAKRHELSRSPAPAETYSKNAPRPSGA